MVWYVIITIHDPFLRPPVNHSFVVVAHQTTNIQLSYCGLVIVQDSPAISAATSSVPYLI